jgi:hypothetical protein
LLIAAAVSLFVIALVVALQISGVLIGVLNPPMPPLPPSATQLGHFVDTAGRDRWAYSAATFVDSLQAFYADEDATCRSAPFTSQEHQAFWDEYPDASDPQLYCEGGQDFARFTMRWGVLVSSAPGSTLLRLDVFRKIDWFADLP